MAKRSFYALPDYKTVTSDLDEYIKAWRELAEPVEKALGVELSGFDPDYAFIKRGKDGYNASVNLPCWFVRDLSAKLKGE